MISFNVSIDKQCLVKNSIPTLALGGLALFVGSSRCITPPWPFMGRDFAVMAGVTAFGYHVSPFGKENDSSLMKILQIANAVGLGVVVCSFAVAIRAKRSITIPLSMSVAFGSMEFITLLACNVLQRTITHHYPSKPANQVTEKPINQSESDSINKAMDRVLELAKRAKDEGCLFNTFALIISQLCFYKESDFKRLLPSLEEDFDVFFGECFFYISTKSLGGGVINTNRLLYLSYEEALKVVQSFPKVPSFKYYLRWNWVIRGYLFLAETHPSHAKECLSLAEKYLDKEIISEGPHAYQFIAEDIGKYYLDRRDATPALKIAIRINNNIKRIDDLNIREELTDLIEETTLFEFYEAYQEKLRLSTGQKKSGKVTH